MPVPTRIYDYRTTAVTWKQTHIIYPDDILLSLWEQDRELWKQLLVGDTDLAGFWERCGRSHWFQHHPCYHEENKSKLIPFSLYGDEIQCFRNTESGSVSVMAWSSDMAFDKPPLHRYYLIAVYAEQTSTDYTYNDIIRALLPRLQKLFSNDESYPWVREGWKFALSSCQGDLKYLVEKLGFNNYRANRFCSRCPCSKTSPNVGLTLGDFRMDAEHTKTRFHHEDYLASSNPEDRSPVWGIPGNRSDRLLHDACHGQLLGTGKVAVCIHSYAQALRVMDTEPLLMSAESAQAYCDHVLLHLQTYAYLHTQSFNTAGSVPNRANWQLLPKHHFFFHSALDVLEAGINPRMYSLLCGESFIGVLGRISKGCHRSNVSLRSIQRYLSCLHFKLQELSSRQLG
ncbi:unnamed protein product [Effrenium voratum]|nr:unnamed protein product [Effrenium voratum]